MWMPSQNSEGQCHGEVTGGSELPPEEVHRLTRGRALCVGVTQPRGPRTCDRHRRLLPTRGVLTGGTRSIHRRSISAEASRRWGSAGHGNIKSPANRDAQPLRLDDDNDPPCSPHVNRACSSLSYRFGWCSRHRPTPGHRRVAKPARSYGRRQDHSIATFNRGVRCPRSRPMVPGENAF